MILQSPNKGLTLLELIASITIIAVITIAGIASFKTSAESNHGAEAGAKRLALDLLQAKRRAISTGDNHYLEFNTTGGKIVSYQLFQKTGTGDVEVAELQSFEKNISVTSVDTTIEYNFEGQALSSSTVTLTGPSRSWQVEVIAVTGFAKVSEIP